MRRQLTFGPRIVTAAAVAALAVLAGASRSAAASDDLADVRREVAARHDEAVKRLQEWIALPSIAAEDRNYPAGGGCRTAAPVT